MTPADTQCLACGGENLHLILNLGNVPLANALPAEAQLKTPELRYPLELAFCKDCALVQLTTKVPPQDMFSEYLYFSSYSDTFLAHAREMAETLTKRFNLGAQNRVLEVASNDGYLLQYFVKRQIPVLGVEPAKNIAAEAVRKDIPTLARFFEPDLVPEIRETFGAVDLLIGNNVLAHVPKPNDFLTAVKACLTPRGVAVFEFPYLQEMLNKTEFDTIYHEHVSYFSLTAINHLAKRAGLILFDVSRQAVHGGSLRVFLQPNFTYQISSQVSRMLADEKALGLLSPEYYAAFEKKVVSLKQNLVDLLKKAKAQKKRIAAYGAPAKAATLLNYCGIHQDIIDYTVDRSPHKQGHFIPGTQIPIYSPEKIKETKPDYLLILPWNLKDEIMRQMAYIRDWGGKFVIPIPAVEVLS